MLLQRTKPAVSELKREHLTQSHEPVRVRLGVVLRVVGLEVEVDDVGLELLGPAGHVEFGG